MRILCALERGEDATGVARVAASFARPFAARLLLAHVVEPLGTTLADRPPHRMLTTHGQEFLQRTALSAGCGDSAEAVVRIGDPGFVLEDLARQWEADIVICGSHGRRSITATVLGSVSRRLIRRCGRAVLVVPAQAAERWDDGEPDGGTLRSIVCGVDGSIVGFEAAEAAGHIAAGLHARLTLVHAYLPVPQIGFSTPPYSVVDVDALADSERRSRTRLLRRAAALVGNGTEVRTVMIDEEAARGVERVAEEQRAGLVIVGSRGRGQLLSSVLGSTSASLAASAARPVLVIREGHAAQLRRLDPTELRRARVSGRK